MMLEHLGESSAASKLMRVIEHITVEPRWHTRDLGGRALTSEVTTEALRLINSI
jgi:tartrate dehydrogenase/decarboxylase/D-malate dehydrogenase